jgi:hypothetical protein
MNEIVNLEKLKAISNVAYVTPEVQVYEIGFENTILTMSDVSGEVPPSMGIDDPWS